MVPGACSRVVAVACKCSGLLGTAFDFGIFGRTQNKTNTFPNALTSLNGNLLLSTWLSDFSNLERFQQHAQMNFYNYLRH